MHNGRVHKKVAFQVAWICSLHLLDNKWYPHVSFGLDSSALTITYILYQICVSISDLGV